MKISSEQEMLDFGKAFAGHITGRVTDMEGFPQSSRREELREGNVRQDPSSEVGRTRASIIELIGDVGAGKTTFVRGFAQGLGITTPITSPSFTISKSYACPDGRTLVHYDFYRLPDPGLMAEDLSDNLKNPNNIIVIEWGNEITNLLPKNHTKIIINYNDDNSREVTIL